MAWDTNLSTFDRGQLQYALASLRMAYDLRQIGDPKAPEYEQAARVALCNVLDEKYDPMRGEC